MSRWTSCSNCSDSVDIAFCSIILSEILQPKRAMQTRLRARRLRSFMETGKSSDTMRLSRSNKRANYQWFGDNGRGISLNMKSAIGYLYQFRLFGFQLIRREVHVGLRVIRRGKREPKNSRDSIDYRNSNNQRNQINPTNPINQRNQRNPISFSWAIHLQNNHSVLA